VSPESAVANPDPEVRCRGRVQTVCLFLPPPRNLRFNHPTLSKVTVLTTTNRKGNMITYSQYL
jgi:hypothetical protein